MLSKNRKMSVREITYENIYRSDQKIRHEGRRDLQVHRNVGYADWTQGQF